MMEQLLHWDSNLLLLINGHHTDWMDTLMWHFSQASTWIPLYLWLIASIIIYTRNAPYRDTVIRLRQQSSRSLCLSVGILLAILAVVAIAASAGLSDFVTSGLLKKTICRPRPTHSDLAPLLHLVNGYTGGHYGFPSSHAANCWAVTTCFLLIQHRLISINSSPLSHYLAIFNAIILPVYALVNCYSRMYLGVHYPLDILCGTIIGVLIALIISRLYTLAFRKITFLAKDLHN